jgi:ribose transport system permease protein
MASEVMKQPSRVSWVGTYGLPVLMVGLFVLFALLLPETYPTMDNITSILSNQTIPAVLALGAMIPIVTGNFDLSMGYGLGLSSVLCMWLIVNTGWPWPIACIVCIALMSLVGIANGLLVEFAQIDSFIATLGTGSVLYAISGWITGGARIVPGVDGLPTSFTDLINAKVLGLPIGTFYIAALAVGLWLILEYLPAGRGLYVIGANPRAAALVGIPKRKYVVGAFVSASLVTGFAGVLLAAQQQIGNPSVGLEYLLPAFVGALLGSTTIRPGRVNAIGTVVAVAILAIGLAGIQQLGAAFWVTPLFNGLTLLLAIGLAGWSSRRRIKSGAEATRKLMLQAREKQAQDSPDSILEPSMPLHTDQHTEGK